MTRLTRNTGGPGWRAVAFTTLGNGTVLTTYEKVPPPRLDHCRELPVKPVRGGMTDAEVDAAWDTHLRHLGHEDG
jgi:hypothetical protein